MTLSPVFRSTAAVKILEEEGVWERLRPAMAAQLQAVETIHADLRNLLDERFLDSSHSLPEGEDLVSEKGLSFLQEYFFLILFRSLFEDLGIPEERLGFYTELNFCIKGTITAADNLFDDQAKSLLPLAAAPGSRFLSILQLMSFERLIRRACDRAVSRGVMAAEAVDVVLRGLLDRMASIGLLEGSEEGGVGEIPPPEEMIPRVHAVRGGALFTLAFVAPRALEGRRLAEDLARAEAAVARLGTAFQIVDDLTDFEFDLGRRSHNLLVSEIHHRGTPAEQEALARHWGGEPVGAGAVEALYRPSARRLLEHAYREAEASFSSLSDLGFWFPPELAREVVHAIVGLDGVARMEALVTPSAGRT